MPDYIEREAALQFVFDACAECMDTCEEFDGIYADCHQCMLEGVKLKLRDMPAANVRGVVRGEWFEKDSEPIFPGMDEHPILGCSKCDFQIYDILGTVRAKYHYCPNCGADMLVLSANYTNPATTGENREVSDVRCWLNNGAEMRGEADE